MTAARSAICISIKREGPWKPTLIENVSLIPKSAFILLRSKYLDI